MEIIGPILISFIAGISTILGSLIIFIKIKRVEEFITFSLSLSLTVMILLSILDLIPSSAFTIVNNYGIYSIPILLLLFGVGVVLINVVDNKIKHSNNNLFNLGLLNMITLILHNLPEGIATFMTSYNDIYMGITLGIAIMLHNIPEGISIAVPLFYSSNNRGRAVLYTLISGLAEPLGALIAYIFIKDYINELTIAYILIIVSGIMISLSINKIYVETLKYNKKKYMLYGIIVGFIIILINHFLL